MTDAALATAIVLYTGSLDGNVLDAAVTSGARALVLKASPVEHIADAIRAAAAGSTYLDPSMTSMLARRRRDDHARSTSRREAQILGLLAGGLTTEQIASDLFLSPNTVQTHVRNATRKLGARGRLHAVILALGRGEIDLSDDVPRARPAIGSGPRDGTFTQKRGCRYGGAKPMSLCR